MLMAGFMAGIVPAMGQEKLEETLYVEGEYVPAVVRQDKIHLLPQKVSFELPAVKPLTDKDLLTGRYEPRYVTLSPPVWRGELAAYPWRGYLTAALGSYLNSNVSAGYRVSDNGTTRADVWLQHNSTSLFHPRMGEFDRDRTRYRYDEQIGFDLRHDMGKSGILGASLSYHLGLFNYYGAVAHSAESGKAPTQTLNDALLRLHWRSAGKNGWQFGVRAEGGIFGYRSNYTVFDYEWQRWSGQREIQAGAGAEVWRRLTDNQRLGIDVDFINLSYNKVVKDGYSRSLQNIRITPAYTFAGERFSARLGIEADVTFGAGKGIHPEAPEMKSSKLHVAPSVRLSYDGGVWNASVSATGGQKMQTLRSGYELDYYQQPMLDYVMPAFVPVEATARLEFGSSPKFRAGIDFTYATVRHLYQGGWYMSELSNYMEDAADFDPLHCNLSGYSIGVDAQWSPISLLTLRGRGTWQPQRQGSTTGFFNGYDRPRWTADAEAIVRPMDALELTVGYRYRGVRNIFRRYGETQESYGERLPDICNLSFGARYRLSRTVTFFGKADNLLGKRIIVLPCQPAEGFNFLVGADVIF